MPKNERKHKIIWKDKGFINILSIVMGRNKYSIFYEGLHGKGLLVHTMLNIITVCYHNSQMISLVFLHSDISFSRRFFKLFLIRNMLVCLSVSMCMLVRVSVEARSLDPPRAGFTRGCGPSEVYFGNHIYCKNNIYY